MKQYSIFNASGHMEELTEQRAEVGEVLHYFAAHCTEYKLIVVSVAADHCHATNPHGGHMHRVEFTGLRHVSEKFGIGIYKTDWPKVSAAAVSKAIFANARFIAEEEAEAKQAAAEAAAQKERLLKEYDYLKLTGTGSGGGTHAAKNIRILLKRNFPGVKFSVRSDYSSVNIHWDNGPTSESVENITDLFSGGSFNGMDDIYEYNRSVFGNLYGSAKYIFTTRNTKEATAAIVRALGAEPNDYCNNEQERREAWAMIEKTDLTNKGEFLRLEDLNKPADGAGAWCPDMVAIFKDLK